MARKVDLMAVVEDSEKFKHDGSAEELVKYAESLEETGFVRLVRNAEHEATLTRIADFGYICIKGDDIPDRCETTEVERFDEEPPTQEVLDILKVHMARKLFDSFEVIYIPSTKDPLLVGRLSHYEHSDDYFFIAQWGSDVVLDDVI